MGLRLLPAAVITALALSACGGGSPGTSPMSIPTNSPATPPVNVTKAAKATGSITFRVPKPTAAKNQLGGKKPQYISLSTNSANFYFDGTSTTFVVSNLPSSGTATSIGAAASNQTATITAVNNAQYYAVTIALSVIPGVHQIGVLTEDANGAVLSEAQAPFTFAAPPATNPDMTLNLNGVLADGYICDSTCSRTPFSTPTTPASQGAAAIYTLYAIPGDVDGDFIPNQNGLTFDNGSYSVVSDTPGVLNIVGAGPFYSPGADATVYGVTTGNQFTVQCATTGMATLELVSAGGSTPADPFSAPLTSPPFPYSASNYPATSAQLGMGVPVSCTATGNLEVN